MTDIKKYIYIVIGLLVVALALSGIALVLVMGTQGDIATLKERVSEFEKVRGEVLVTGLEVTSPVSTIQTAEINASVVNKGMESTTRTLRLKIAGKVVDTREITLGPGESKITTFKVKKGTEGEYDVTLDGKIGTLKVIKKEPIKVGIMSPMTGPLSGWGLSDYQVKKLQFELINEHGGLLDGKPVKLIERDCGTLEEDKVRSGFLDFIKKEKVDAILCSLVHGVVDIHTAGKSDIPYLHTSVLKLSNEIVAKNREEYSNVFSTIPPSYHYGYSGPKRILEDYIPWLERTTDFKSNKRAAVIVAKTTVGKEVAQGFRDLINEKNWELVYETKVTPGLTEWRPILTKLRGKKADIVNVTLTSNSSIATFVRQLKLNPFNIVVVPSYCSSQQFWKIAGEDGQGVFGQTQGGMIPGKEEVYGADWLFPGKGLPEERWKKLYEERWDEPPTSMALAWSYDRNMIWVKAVRELGTTDHRKVREYIRTHEMEGFGGRYVFRDSDLCGKVGPDLLPVHLMQWQDGNNPLVYPEKYREADAIVQPWIKS